MSIRAYKIIEIKTEKKPTLTNEELNLTCDYRYNDEQFDGAVGIITFDEDILREALKTEEDYKTRQAIKKILKDISKGDNMVDYYCY
jgi:hypothetical protein